MDGRPTLSGLRSLSRACRGTPIPKPSYLV